MPVPERVVTISYALRVFIRCNAARRDTKWCNSGRGIPSAVA